jgi:hypothetical protein
MHLLSVRAKLSRPLAQITRIDQRMVWHDMQTTAAKNRSAVACHGRMLARPVAATISDGGSMAGSTAIGDRRIC